MITYETEQGTFKIDQKKDFEQTQSKAETIIDQPHSVKFSINAKLQYSAEIKVYAKTPEEALK